MTDLAAAIEASLGRVAGEPVRLRRQSPIGGGTAYQVTHIETTAGDFVVKSTAHEHVRMLQAEADGLAALRASGTTLVIPRVIAVETGPPAFILIEYLAPGPRPHGFDEAFGRGLAEIHRSAHNRFGFTGDNYCGATRQPNPWTDRWVDFYRDARLGHQRDLALGAGLLSGRDADEIERLLQRLGELIDEPKNGPSLIHGDLWSGNLIDTADGRPALIDPAVSYAHREAELGMMTLFGGFSSRMFAAYDDAFPLEGNWRERSALYQLYHLMNHLNLFGRGYHAQVMSIVRRYA